LSLISKNHIFQQKFTALSYFNRKPLFVSIFLYFLLEETPLSFVSILYFTLYGVYLEEVKDTSAILPGYTLAK